VDIARIKLAVRRHIARARKALRQSRLDDEAVHDARKDLKRARSGLRLLRPLDEAAYQRENTRLRDAARRLSAVRDDKVLLARLGELLRKEKEPALRRLVLRLRKELDTARRRHWRELCSARELRRIDDALAIAAEHVGAWRVPEGADAALALAVRQIYEKGRKALRRPRQHPTDKRLHEARKQAKHLAHALEILAGQAPPKEARKVLKRAGKVGDYLGDDRDLAVVEASLQRLPVGHEKAKRRLRQRIEKRRARLQKMALKAGRKLYRRKTRVLLFSLAGGSARERRAAAARLPSAPAAAPA
jgi:CHAD domain-containing protein